MRDLEPLVDGKVAARFLGVSYSTLLRWSAMGCGPPSYHLGALSRGNVKKGGRRVRRAVRFRLSEVDAWARDRRA